MKKWKLIEMAGISIMTVSIVFITAIVLSDGSRVEQFRMEEQIEKTLLKNPIDWPELKKLNANIYAWLYVPGTKIDYPVLQSDTEQQEDFYLNHNVENHYDFAGSIYSRKENEKDFQDPVTVIYGHNMINGSMFGTLKKFESKDFFEQHSTLYVYLPDKVLQYRILAYYVTDDKNILNTYQPQKKKGFQDYVESFFRQSGNIRDKPAVLNKDKIVTLSTCSSLGTNRRLLQGVLEKEQLTK